MKIVFNREEVEQILLQYASKITTGVQFNTVNARLLSTPSVEVSFEAPEQTEPEDETL